MTKEQLTKIVQNDMFIREVYREFRRRERIRFNKDMHEIFTPWYVKLWHKFRGIKPYENIRYSPKF